MIDRHRPTLHEWRRAILSEQGPTPATARLVALALAQDMNTHSLETFASAERIAITTQLSERTVRAQLHALVEQGWLIESTASRGRAHWRKVRRASMPDAVEVAVMVAGTQERGVAATVAGSQGEAATVAGTSLRETRVAATNDLSGGKRAHRVAATVAGDLVDLSRSDLGAAGPSPATAGSAARNRKPNLEQIAQSVRGLADQGMSDAEILRLLPATYGLTEARIRTMREST